MWLLLLVLVLRASKLPISMECDRARHPTKVHDKNRLLLVTAIEAERQYQCEARRYKCIGIGVKQDAKTTKINY